MSLNPYDRAFTLLGRAMDCLISTRTSSDERLLGAMVELSELYSRRKDLPDEEVQEDLEFVTHWFFEHPGEITQWVPDLPPAKKEQLAEEIFEAYVAVRDAWKDYFNQSK